MKERQRILLVILSFGIMFIMGWIDNIRGVLVPSIKGDFGVNYTSVASMMLLSTFGYILATFTGGMLTERFGHKKIVLLGFTILMLSVWSVSTAQIFYLLITYMIGLGYGLGLLTVGASTLAPVIFIRNQGMMMNLFHFFYGVGATIGPRYAGYLLTLNFTWKQIYLYSLIMVSLFLVFFVFCKFPKVETPESDKIPFKQLISDRRVILFSLMLGFYVGAEVGIGNWLVTYLQKGRGMNELESASFLSAFYIIFTIGRLFGGFAVEKIGYMKAVRYSVMTSIVVLFIGIYINKSLVFFIPLSGLFLSITYPTSMTVVMRTFNKGLSTIIGVVMTTASTINMLTNWAIGRVNDLFGESFGFGLIPFYQIATLIFLLLLQHYINQEDREIKN